MATLHSWFGFGIDGSTVAQIIRDANMTQLTIEREKSAQQHAMFMQQAELDSQRRKEKNQRVKAEIEHTIQSGINEFAKNRSPEHLAEFRNRADNAYRAIEYARIRCALAMLKLKAVADLNHDLVMQAPTKYQTKLLEALNRLARSNHYNYVTHSTERQLVTALDLSALAQPHIIRLLSKLLADPPHGTTITRPEAYSASSITDGAINFRLRQEQYNIQTAYDRAAVEAGRLYAFNSAITRALVSTPALVKLLQPKSIFGFFNRKDVAALIAGRIDQAGSLLNERLADQAYVERLLPIAIAMTNIDDSGCVAGFVAANIHNGDLRKSRDSFISVPRSTKDLDGMITFAWKAYTNEYSYLVKICAEQSVINHAIAALREYSPAVQVATTAQEIERSFESRRNYLWGKSALGIKGKSQVSPKLCSITDCHLHVRCEFDQPLKGLHSEIPSTWHQGYPEMPNVAVLERIEFCRDLIGMTSQRLLAVNVELVAAANSLAKSISTDKVKAALDGCASIDEWILCAVKAVADDPTQINMHCTDANQRFNAQLDHYLSPLIYVGNFEKPLSVPNAIVSALA